MAKLVPQMLTANRLRDGEVVYWRNGEWVEAYADGQIFPDDAGAEAALAAAQDFVKRNIVVATYLLDVKADGTPVKEREIIRAAGPSVRTDMGKQASSTSPLVGRSTRAESASTSGGGRCSTETPPPTRNAAHSVGTLSLPTPTKGEAKTRPIVGEPDV